MFVFIVLLDICSSIWPFSSFYAHNFYHIDFICGYLERQKQWQRQQQQRRQPQWLQDQHKHHQVCLVPAAFKPIEFKYIDWSHCCTSVCVCRIQCTVWLFTLVAKAIVNTSKNWIEEEKFRTQKRLSKKKHHHHQITPPFTFVAFTLARSILIPVHHIEKKKNCYTRIHTPKNK